MEADYNYKQLEQIAEVLKNGLSRIAEGENLEFEIKCANPHEMSKNLKNCEERSNEATQLLSQNSQTYNPQKIFAGVEQADYQAINSELEKRLAKEKGKKESYDRISIKFDQDTYEYRTNQKMWFLYKKKGLFERQKNLIHQKRYFRCDISKKRDNIFNDKNTFIQEMLKRVRDEEGDCVLRYKYEDTYFFKNYKIIISKVIELRHAYRLVKGRALDLAGGKRLSQYPKKEVLEEKFAAAIKGKVESFEKKIYKYEAQLHLMPQAFKEFQNSTTEQLTKRIGGFFEVLVSLFGAHQECELNEMMKKMKVTQ